MDLLDIHIDELIPQRHLATSRGIRTIVVDKFGSKKIGQHLIQVSASSAPSSDSTQVPRVMSRSVMRTVSWERLDAIIRKKIYPGKNLQIPLLLPRSATVFVGHEPTVLDSKFLIYIILFKLCNTLRAWWKPTCSKMAMPQRRYLACTRTQPF